jgi:ABC-2 type transport system ATP-binding protein
MIQIESLEYYYQKKSPLFENLDLYLKPGSICGLLGKNGAGKSTLLKLMAGLLFPKQGSLEVMQETPRKRTVAFLQNVYFLPDTFELPAISMKRYLATYARFYPQFNTVVYEEAFNEFELEEAKNLAHLSRGQQKKFLLAFGFATGAKLLLFDEPTNALDIPSKQQFRKLLAAHLDMDRTFVISTHQIKDIEHLLDSLVILDQGKIIFNQSQDAIQDRLLFRDSTEKPSDDVCFYAEKSPGGYTVLEENLEGDTSLLDLETLFNAVLKNQKKINTCFKGK